MKQSQIKDYTSPKAHYWPAIVPASGSTAMLRLLVIHCAFAFPFSLLKKPAGLLTPASPTPVSLEPGPHFVISQPSPCVPFSLSFFFNSQKLSHSFWPVTLFLRFTSWHARSWGLSRFIALQSLLQKVTTLSVIHCFYVQEPTKSTMSFINIYIPKLKWFQRPRRRLFKILLTFNSHCCYHPSSQESYRKVKSWKWLIP